MQNLFTLFLHSFIKIKYDSVAQLVEQYTFNVWVLGSSPSRITTFKNNPLLSCTWEDFFSITGDLTGNFAD